MHGTTGSAIAHPRLESSEKEKSKPLSFRTPRFSVREETEGVTTQAQPRVGVGGVGRHLLHRRHGFIELEDAIHHGVLPYEAFHAGFHVLAGQNQAADEVAFRVGNLHRVSGS